MKTSEEFIKDYKNLNWSIKRLIEEVQKDAYNQCLIDLIVEDLLPDSVVNYKKYKK